jgi:antitoxin component HigA of HigAB toxin-antitoxin module
MKVIEIDEDLERLLRLVNEGVDMDVMSERKLLDSVLADLVALLDKAPRKE